MDGCWLCLLTLLLPALDMHIGLWSSRCQTTALWFELCRIIYCKSLGTIVRDTILLDFHFSKGLCENRQFLLETVMD